MDANSTPTFLGVILSCLPIIHKVGCLIFEASNIKHPTLCIIGKHDKMTPKKVGVELASKIKDSKSVILEESGHMSVLETASDTKNLLKDFFRAHRNAS